MAAGGSVPEAGAQPASAMVPTSVLKQLSVEQLLEQPVVSVSRRPEHLGQAASSVFVIPGDAVTYVAASGLPDLLRLAPNLFVAQADSMNWGVASRGFLRTNATANKLLVLIDGRTVYSPFFSNVFWDVQDTFLPDLEHIEVISGPAGANWGANAVNGVINILTKSAHETLGSRVETGWGTEQKYYVAARQGVSFGRHGSARVYAQARKRDSTLNAAGVDDDFDDGAALQAGFRADWGQQWTLQGDVYRVRTERQPSPAVRAEGYNVLGKWEAQLAPDSQLTLKAYHDYAMRNLSRQYVARTRTSDLEFQHRIDFDEGDQEFVWGANYRLISDEVVQTTAEFAIIPAKLDFHLFGGFVQHELRWRDARWSLVSGLRLERNDFSGWELQPNLRLAWRPGSWSTFWAGVSRATRTPSRLEQGFFAPRDPPHVIVGNPDIDSESLTATEIGGRWQLRREISFTSTLFHHEYDDLRSVEFQAPVFTQLNGVRGQATGVELFVDWDVSERWRLRLGGTWIDQQSWNKPGHADLEQARGEVSFPRHHVQLRNTFSLTETLSLWMGLRRVDEVAVQDGPDRTPVPAYTELDLNLTWAIRPEVDLSLIGRNLLDASHPEIGALPNRREIERSGEVVMRWRF